MRAERKVFVWTGIFVMLMALVVVVFAEHPPSSVYAVYTSPSGNYRLVVHRYRRLLAMPGDASGAPGYVELFDKGGKKLGVSQVPLVLGVSSEDDIRWYEHDVSAPGLFDFPVPHP